MTPPYRTFPPQAYYAQPVPFIPVSPQQDMAGSPKLGVSPAKQFSVDAPSFKPSSGGSFVPTVASFTPSAAPFTPSAPKRARDPSLMFKKADTLEPVVSEKLLLQSKAVTPPPASSTTPPAALTDATPFVPSAQEATAAPAAAATVATSASAALETATSVAATKAEEGTPAEAAAAEENVEVEVELSPEELYPPEYISTQWSPFNQVFNMLPLVPFLG